MVSTNMYMPMHEHLKAYPYLKYKHFNFAPLSEFAKLGDKLKSMYIVQNTITDKLQLWRSDFKGMHFLNSSFSNYEQFLSPKTIEQSFKTYSTKQVVPFEFDDINILLDYNTVLHYPYMAFLITENAKIGMFLYCEENLYLVDWYDSIKEIGCEYLLAQNNNEYFILDKMGGKVVYIERQVHFKRLISKDAYLAEANNKQFIKKFDGSIMVPIIIGDFIRFTNDSHYLSQDKNGYSILDFYGNVMTGGYDKIKNSSDKYIIAEKNKEFFILNPSGQIVLSSYDYMTITRTFWKNQ
ncbi:MAG: hypothetical protein HDS97_07200 [Bacteroidales bacterium]|nr:hypothetical protein [Bacteroidales bacterium]